MKKILLLVSVAIVLSLASCTIGSPELKTTSDYEYEYMEPAPSAESTAGVSEGVSEENAGDVILTETVPPAESTTAENAPSENQQTTSQPAETTAKPEGNTGSSISGDIGNVDLSISMPEKNGTMVADKSSSNKYIMIVNQKRRISTDKLVAVFSVPESGQNYVFEFRNETARSADDIRRVYLIDSDGSITSVAAADGSEKENVSAVENWFCMNVLIKEMIYPAMESQIK